MDEIFVVVGLKDNRGPMSMIITYSSPVILSRERTWLTGGRQLAGQVLNKLIASGSSA